MSFQISGKKNDPQAPVMKSPRKTGLTYDEHEEESRKAQRKSDLWMIAAPRSWAPICWV